MVVNINMTAFTDAAGQTSNVLNTGDITSVISHIDASNATLTNKFIACMQCLSQTLNSDGPFQGKCESYLKEKIFDLAKKKPAEAQEAIKDSTIRYDEKLSSTIKKVKYLSAGVWGLPGGNYVRKLGHHIFETCGNNRNLGTTYLLAGATVTFTRGVSSIFALNATDGGQGAGSADMFIGASLMAFPLLNSIIKARGDEP
ncbi:hypothetical protein [Neochlamydia sp. S13]|uniref:hypothetical protein n=1 Tax=Neochlamydia sp. S13 TaxID=1353976 RepID=UPI0005A9BF8D|nr:hypothetical protein [Neochlamydia sp. S13]BBI18189.1 Putative uncharacterized protein [Neochlamydia sp. S13]